jgi:hypothetical protein
MQADLRDIFFSSHLQSANKVKYFGQTIKLLPLSSLHDLFTMPNLFDYYCLIERANYGIYFAF